MNVRLLRRQLLRWFGKHQRNHYPWRHTKDPFHILIAETFLQRTKANQVLPVYKNFLLEFPTIAELATANEETVRKLVYPLGLSWRAKNLKQTAQDIQEKFGGIIPQNRDDLIQIKGVGDYVADCIRYQAFEIRTSIIDSNVVRVFGRLYGITTHAESRRDVKFRELADVLLPPIAFRKFNLALLDLGALVCVRIPRCENCPVKKHCKYYNASKLT